MRGSSFSDQKGGKSESDAGGMVARRARRRGGWVRRGEHVCNLAEFSARMSDGRSDILCLGRDWLGLADDGERQPGLGIRLRSG